ncbi:hypothetical protein Vretimale_15618 [Volvox reticuliferus]|uniref:PPM-type phosphatase domain-containing protein n=1 Tax=Volvox reticuliferus TaxID=1737510 RepID=A0A8J4LV84_9CHLO|nr:hypothetical protein Vretifemale_15020 [Volvox reticuliferus]GIM12226.1 hypothetical protein Vretimale_15618 [Volvox reticuliferus]
MQGWARSRAQQQLLWDTLQSLKDKASLAFDSTNVRQPLDPFRETYSDGGLFGAGCNYAVGFHGIQGRQPKSEDYVLHLALGPNLFAPFDDCARACLACVLDGHGGIGAVQYVAERFPSYLLADLPRLRVQPAAAMRSALHRIDEELTALGHNSGTTVNALLLIDNHITVVNTGDCRCILYDWVDERAVQVTHDHNLHCIRERERVLGEGAELSGCGGYVVLPCPTDGAKLLGVTKALGHAGVKALQRSFTMGSLNSILGSALTPQGELQQRELLHLSQVQQQQQALPRLPEIQSQRSSTSCVLAAWDQGPGRRCQEAATLAAVARAGMAYAVSGSGISDDDPAMPASASIAINGRNGAGFLVDVDMCSSCLALTGCSCRPVSDARGQLRLLSSTDNASPVPVDATFSAPTVVAATAANGTTSSSSIECAPVCCSAAPAIPPLQRCMSSINHKSSFATAAGAAVAAAVASSPVGLMHAETDAGQLPPLAAAGTGGSFVLTCEPDEFEFTVEDDRHLVLLGCDGVFDRMGNAEACKTAVRQLTASNSCIDAAREITHRACRLGSLDNITALVLRFGRKPIVRRQSFSVLSLRRSSSNMSNDLAAAGSSTMPRA